VGQLLKDILLHMASIVLWWRSSRSSYNL